MIPRILEPTPTAGQAPSHAPPDVHFAPRTKIATGLGWFSIGLGLAEVLAPHAMAEITGVRRPSLVFLCGLREIATGVLILSSNDNPAPWVWARVAGDAMDLAILAETVATGESEDRTKALVSMGAVAGVTAADVMTAAELSAGKMAEG
jgi:hypothetical protein